ncbi:hypothetical protein [Anatilimnocola floriformis]|uniref:hypothetical protein n=1 Tax=Anatilimnocola floriformis TaxID=2948575 RepID=UPI0020C50DA9|nr:hypothetical protein [Anatilimnocola floriformis]
MSRHCSRRAIAGWLVAGALLLPALLLPTNRASAVEPAAAFLDGLRQRQLFDVALDYLDAAAKNPAVPVDFKQSLQYERGVTLVEGARVNRDWGLKEKQLDEGQATLEKFVAANPQSMLAIAARSQLATVVVERARARMKRAEKMSGAAKLQLYVEARGFYGQALKVFEELAVEIETKLKTYPASISEKGEPKKYAERDQFRKDAVQAEVLTAATREEMSETYEVGNKDRTTALEEAVAEYGEMYDKYRTRMAGLYSRMYQARCLQKLGRHKEALGYFVELLANPDHPEPFRLLRVKVTDQAIESWIELKLFLEVIDKNKPKSPAQLVDSARGAEEKDDDFMSIRLGIARTMKLYAEDLKAREPKDPSIKKLLQEGGKLVRLVAKTPGAHQEKARAMLPDFGGESGEDLANEKPDPKNFAEARKAGLEAVDAMQSGNGRVREMSDRLKALTATHEIAALQKQLDELKKQTQTAKEDASRYLKLALVLADRGTNVDDVNLCRYLLCFLAFSSGNYQEAAVFGEFIARRYPEAHGARQCGSMTLDSYIKLYAESDPNNPEENKDFEAQQIISICKYLSQRWPDTPEAAKAINTLIPFMIKEHRLDDAQAYLDQIPLDAPNRGPAELKIGQSLWAEFYDGSRELRDYENAELKPEGIDPVKKKAELDALKAKAKAILIDGVARMQGTGEVSAITVTAAWSLAQMYVDTNEATKAVELLENSKTGPLELARQNDATTNRAGFKEEIYKTALRAYISSLSAAGANSDDVIKKAEGVMASLDELYKNDAQGQAKLIGIYVSLAKDLQNQMELADPATKVALGKGFEAFLGQMSNKANDVKILRWVAETYTGMGESFGPGTKKKLSDEAVRYYGKATATFERILKLNEEKPGTINPAMATSIRMEIATIYRATNKYKEAMNLFDEILKTQNMLVTVQLEAAKTYQDWGAQEGAGMAENYQRAIFGARPHDGRNNIWGWGQLAKLVYQKPEHRATFHEARFNLVYCRYAFAMKQTGEEKTKQLTMAKKDIASMYGLFPDLGGEKWKPQYVTLLKNIQKGLGEEPVGLAMFKFALPEETTPVATPAKNGPAPPKGAPATTPTKTSPPVTPAKTVAPAIKGSTPAPAIKNAAPAAKPAPAKS